MVSWEMRFSSFTFFGQSFASATIDSIGRLRYFAAHDRNGTERTVAVTAFGNFK